MLIKKFTIIAAVALVLPAQPLGAQTASDSARLERWHPPSPTNERNMTNETKFRAKDDIPKQSSWGTACSCLARQRRFPH